VRVRLDLDTDWESEDGIQLLLDTALLLLVFLWTSIK